MPKADTSKVPNLQPLGERVVVKPLGKEEKVTAFGIIIPEGSEKERPAKGTVIAVGPGKYEDGVFQPMNVKVGQTVLFSKYGYDEVKVDDVEYLIVFESSILAVIS
jgi:chaperonin GroES